MNDEFIEGFVKTAINKGYDDDAIASLFKLAMADSEVVELIDKALSQNNETEQ